MNNLHVTNKELLIDDFKNFIFNPQNFADEVKTSKWGKAVNPKLYLYCDIETFTFNCLQATLTTPRAFKNATFIVQVAWFEKEETLPNWAYFKDFKEFFKVISDNGCEELKHYDIQLVFHNGMKYDNHFLEKELINYLHIPLYNNINEKSINSKYNHLLHDDAIKKVPTFYKDRDHDWLSVSSIRSSTSHSLAFSYKGFFFETQDSYLKTNDPLVMVGNKCKEKGLLTDEYIKDKSDIDFTDKKYNVKYDLSDDEVEEHKKELLNSLTNSEFKYVRNDVVVLAMCHKHFSELYYGFSWDEFTFSGNVKKSYEKQGYFKDLTNFQLTKKTPKAKMRYNRYKDKDSKVEETLTLNDKKLAGWKSAEKFFRQFYRGGLNMYNEKYIGKIIEPKQAGFSMDLNSSYPTVMYKEKLPTYLVDSNHFGKIKRVPKDPNYFYMFTLKPKTMDTLLQYVESRVIRQMFVKYYPVRNDGFVYINSVALNTLEKFMSRKIDTLRYIHCYKWKAEPFGARNVISDNYYIKQQGKSKVLFKKPWNPLDITPTQLPNTDLKTADEVQASKVLLNGIYGIPAMRPTFPQFLYTEDGKAISMPDGHLNTERNVVFSVGVTAFAFRNLITPLTYLSPDEIDDYFWYCDTDSLYLDGAVRDKLLTKHSELFNANNLGCWDLEHTNITKFYAFNHKKYALYDESDKQPLSVRAGGVTKSNLKSWIDDCTKNHNDSQALNMLVEKYFHNGAKIKTTRSIKTEYGTIAIYDGISILQDGHHNGNKTKHYLNSYAESLEQKSKVIEFVNDNYDAIVSEFDNEISQVGIDNDISIVGEIEINGILETLSYDGVNEIKNFRDNIDIDSLFTGNVSKKEQNRIITYLKECDDKLIHLYKSYRTFIDFQNERLEVLACDKLFNNLKFYFYNPYLAKEISNGVYITVDFRIIRKDNLKEYKIDRANFTVRYNGEKHLVFNKYVELFHGFAFTKKIKKVEEYLDQASIEAWGYCDDVAYYKTMYVNGWDRPFRDPENENYLSKPYIGYRINDLQKMYFHSMSPKLRKKVQDYISNYKNKYDK